MRCCADLEIPGMFEPGLKESATKFVLLDVLMFRPCQNLPLLIFARRASARSLRVWQSAEVKKTMCVDMGMKVEYVGVSEFLSFQE